MRLIARPIILAAVGLGAGMLWLPPARAADPFVPTTIDHYFNPHGKLSRCEVDARAHGAVGDGVTDDTAAIQRAIDLTPAGGTLCVSDGTHLIDAGRSLVLKSAFRLKLASGAILRAKANALAGYAVLKILDKNDIVIEGGIIQGERAEHRGTTGEWGMGIDVRGSRRVTIRGVRIQDCWGDGIYLGRGKTTITNEEIDIFDVTAYNNRRQGISIITGKGVALVRTVLANTGSTPPSAGLDIEPNAADEPIEKIHILDLTTRGNRGAGLLIALGQLRPHNRSSINVHQHTDIGSRRPLELYAVTTAGAVRIHRTNWSGPDTSPVIQRSCAFSLVTAGLFPRPPSATLAGCRPDKPGASPPGR